LESQPNLRHLRVLVVVVETGSVTRASQVCNISQPAVTQALKRLESQFGVSLFNRSANGVFANALARQLAARVARALELIDVATAALAPRLKLTATTAKLRALVAVAETENFSIAARTLGMAQPTIHRAITQLEGEIGRALFKRTQYGSTPTRAGRLLANAAQLAFAELAQAEMELAETVGRGTLQITLGGLPLSRSYILPQVIASYQGAHPEVCIRALEGPYDTLLAGLRQGRVDFLFGALRDPLPIADIEQDHLFDDELVVVSGPDHPLAEQSAPKFSAAMVFPWVVAIKGTPARNHFDAFLARHDTPQPAPMVETSSMVLMRELLHAGPYLGCISRLQAESEIRSGLMVPLPFSIRESRRKIGITTRANWKPTRTQADFLALVRAQFKMASD
jgi:LysR family transcriptional regulator, regulator for genes of the gallate degradation pathway